MGILIYSRSLMYLVLVHRHMYIGGWTLHVTCPPPHLPVCLPPVSSSITPGCWLWLQASISLNEGRREVVRFQSQSSWDVWGVRDGVQLKWCDAVNMGCGPCAWQLKSCVTWQSTSCMTWQSICSRSAQHGTKRRGHGGAHRSRSCELQQVRWNSDITWSC